MKIEKIENQLKTGLFVQVILAGATSTAFYFLAMAWVEKSFLTFLIAGVIALSLGCVTLVYSIGIFKVWMQLKRVQMLMDLEEATRRFERKL